MKAGNFNIDDYLERLYEGAEEKQKQSGFMDGGEGVVNSDGILIPDENKKSYDWLKKEFQKARVEVKVEMKMGGEKFEPGYDLQTNLDSVKDFKPGMFGEVKTADTKGEAKKPASLDGKKENPGFGKKEGEKGPEKPGTEKPGTEKPGEKKSFGKTDGGKGDIKNKVHQKHEEGESKEKEEEEHEGDDHKEPKEKGENTEVKKIDLKTKKK